MSSSICCGRCEQKLVVVNIILYHFLNVSYHLPNVTKLYSVEKYKLLNNMKNNCFILSHLYPRTGFVATNHAINNGNYDLHEINFKLQTKLILILIRTTYKFE